MSKLASCLHHRLPLLVILGYVQADLIDCSLHCLIVFKQKIGPRMLDQEGKEVPGNKGYK